MYNDKYIHLDYLSDSCSGDKAFIREMIDSFLRDAPEVLENLVKFTQAADWRKAADLAHNFKSSLRFMGISMLADPIREVEMECRSGQNQDRIARSIEQIRSVTSQAMEELRGYQANHPAES